MFDTHIHSSFSVDSEMDANKACKKAINLGLDGIVFTDHLDFDFPGCDFILDFNEYSSFMDLLKKDYSDNLTVLKGLEAGIQPHTIDRTSDIIKSYNFDYVLASVHILDGMDPYDGIYYRDKGKKEAYRGYLEAILFMVQNFPDFDSLSHIDYITRCSFYNDRSLKYKEHSDIMDEIFQTLIAKGKGIEINTGSYKEIYSQSEFDIDILKRYRELGGEIICTGSDAHSLKYIGYMFGYVKTLLLNAGFKYTTVFKKRIPEFYPI
jgi:histidinol-phosphatase (PHP family)